MSIIDKFYTSSWKEYQEVVNWVNSNKFTCPNGIVVKPRIYKYDKEDFDGKEIPIMNTSIVADYFLIKYCPIKLVQERIREIYDDYIDSIINEYDTFVRPEVGTKIKMIKRYSPYKRIFKSFNSYSNKYSYWVNVEVLYNNSSLWYNEDYDIFLLPNELGIAQSSCAHLRCKSLKALIRKIKQWKLPKGSIIFTRGRHLCENWKFIIK